MVAVGRGAGCGPSERSEIAPNRTMRRANAADHEYSFLTRRRTLYVPRAFAAGDSYVDTTSNCRVCSRRLAHTHRGGHLRLPHCDDRIRAAVFARLLPHPDVAGAPLGPRRILDGARHPEPAVGNRTAFRRRHCRSLRRQPGDDPRRYVLCARPRPDGVRHHARHARHFSRRADRARPVRLFVQSRNRRFR